MRKEIVLTKKEFQEVENAIKAKMWFQYFFGGANVVVATAIYTLSETGVEVESTLIYVLVRVFVLCGLFGFAFLGKGVASTVALTMFKQGKCEVVECEKPHFCENYRRRELQGKHYVMLKCCGIRYALRLQKL